MWIKKERLPEYVARDLKDILGISIENPSETISEESDAELSKVLKEGFTEKLINLIETSELYPKMQIKKLLDDLAEAKKNEGRMEEQIRMLEEELRKLRKEKNEGR